MANDKRSRLLSLFFISLQRYSTKIIIQLEPNKRILIAPLDWGLGHATRCVPIIRQLLLKNCTVFIASSGRALFLLQKEFPQLKSFEIAAYDPIYPESSLMVIKMALQLPKFLKTINHEQRQIEKIIERNQIDVIISDNRYGCFSKKVKSILITHQLNIQMPSMFKWMEGGVNRYNAKKIKQFSECWVPALEQSLISLLTENRSSLNIRYIGYLSRFEKKSLPVKYDVCLICSGPEPQRSILERIVRTQLKKSSLNSIIIRGKTEAMNKVYKKEQSYNIVNYLAAEEMNEVIEQSALVISRPGYSTVMDLAKLNKKAVFIPTPGQTEQEYLATELSRNRIAYYTEQDTFDLEEAIAESKKYTGFTKFEYETDLLNKAIDSIL